MKREDYPTVTQILGLLQDWSMVDPQVLAWAAEKGTKVHRICESIAMNLMLMEEITPEIEGYIESFSKWFTFVDEILLVEERLYSDKWHFSGKPDIIVRIGKLIYLPDLKTPLGMQPTWQGQGAAYRHLAAEDRGIHTDHVGSLRLRKDGKMPIFNESTDTERDLHAFFNGVQFYNYFKGA